MSHRAFFRSIDGPIWLRGTDVMPLQGYQLKWRTWFDGGTYERISAHWPDSLDALGVTHWPMTSRGAGCSWAAIRVS